MSLDNPLSFFDVTGKVALITGASGAFGAVAARCLSGAGCKVVLAAGNAEAMEAVMETMPGLVQPPVEKALSKTSERAASRSRWGVRIRRLPKQLMSP